MKQSGMYHINVSSVCVYESIKKKIKIDHCHSASLSSLNCPLMGQPNTPQWSRQSREGHHGPASCSGGEATTLHRGVWSGLSFT